MMFSGCFSLEYVEARYVQVVESMAFSNCPSLRICKLSNNYQLNSRVFFKAGLEEFDVSGASFVGYGHFELCTFLKTLYFAPKPLQFPLSSATAAANFHF